MARLKNTKQRKEELRQVAYSLGMEFHEKDEWGLLSLLKDFALFKKGFGRKAFNILQKKTGLLEEKISIMDYQYTVSSGNSAVTFVQTVFFIQSKQLALPEMLLKPENFFHKIGAWLGMQDIDFVEHPEFSNKFLLQGEDEERIRRTMNEKIMRFFLVEKKWCMESIGYYLVFYKERTQVKPAAVKSLYEKGMALYEHLKNKDE
ncbi:MAG: hypothetical protein ACE5FF_01555 [Saprospiraceae bacterium]